MMGTSPAEPSSNGCVRLASKSRERIPSRFAMSSDASVVGLDANFSPLKLAVSSWSRAMRC